MEQADALPTVSPALSPALPAQAQRALRESEAAPRPFAAALHREFGPAGEADPKQSRAAPASGDSTPEYELSWGDLLDIVNPLQHIPIVSSLYRALTGDAISGTARVIGSTLFGGPLGMVAGAANAIMAEASGAGLGDTLVAGLLGKDPPGAPGEGGTLLAEAEPAPASEAPTEAPGEAPGEPVLASAFAPRATAPDRALTGDAALSALLGDLRQERSRSVPDAMPPLAMPALAMPAVPTAAVTAAPLPPPAARSGVVSAQAQAQTPAPGAPGAPGAVPLQSFATQMMLGLEKYRAMAIERGGAGRPNAQALDRSL